jgi:hypothetical protein
MANHYRKFCGFLDFANFLGGLTLLTIDIDYEWLSSLFSNCQRSKASKCKKWNPHGKKLKKEELSKMSCFYKSL